MAKTFTAPFAQNFKNASAVCTQASTFVDTAPTNTQLLLTAGADDSLITKITAMPRATVTANNLLLWISYDGGTTKYLKDSVLMPAQTINTTTAINVIFFPNYSEATPLRIPAGASLYVGSAVALAAGIAFNAEYADM